MSVPPAGSDIPPSTPPGDWPPSPTTGGVGTAVYETTQDDRTMAMLAYILGIFTGFLGPLIIWLLKKDQSKFVAYHGLQALLLHVFVTIGYMLSGVLIAVLIGFLTGPAFFIFGLVYAILAGLAANKGEWYEIPIIGKFARQSVGM